MDRTSVKKVSILSFVFSVVFTVVFVSQVFAGNIANYPVAKQEQTNWCWAASSVSILSYYGKSVSQCSFVKATQLKTTCDNVGETVRDVQNGLAWYSIHNEYYSGSLSWTSLKAQIDTGYPIYVSWAWTSGGGHAVVIYGYSESGQYVNYMDPLDGTKIARTYTSFVGGSSYDRTWRWGINNIHN
ncbi:MULTISPECIES: C39 family peptidase [Paenibacillus]|uniref:C39 family peptidase n=1 Tax=Paenibacillus TaxID=44249 RepID=UPI0011A11BD7|nr:MULTISPECIES: C39 family peptidase [Paenibacillus]MBJ9993256.1 C39 family peptidase [Paenibacillus sp. S28]